MFVGILYNIYTPNFNVTHSIGLYSLDIKSKHFILQVFSPFFNQSCRHYISMSGGCSFPNVIFFNYHYHSYPLFFFIRRMLPI